MRRSKYFKHIPTSESIQQNRFLKPFSRYLHHHYLWQFNRRGVAGGLAVGLFVGILIPLAGFASLVDALRDGGGGQGRLQAGEDGGNVGRHESLVSRVMAGGFQTSGLKVGSRSWGPNSGTGRSPGPLGSAEGALRRIVS